MYPSPSKSAQHVLKLLERWVAEPTVTGRVAGTILHSDNGGEFMNETVEGFKARHRMQTRNGRPYHPQSQGKLTVLCFCSSTCCRFCCCVCTHYHRLPLPLVPTGLVERENRVLRAALLKRQLTHCEQTLSDLLSALATARNGELHRSIKAKPQDLVNAFTSTGKIHWQCAPNTIDHCYLLAFLTL